MKYVKFIILFSILALLFISACKSQSNSSDLGKKLAVFENTAPVESIEVHKDLLLTPYSGKILAGSSSPYIEFNKADYDKAASENKIIVLNFYADWCPTCRSEQPHVFAAFNSLNDENIVGFQVNYKDKYTDKDEKEMAKEFGITYQHTKVIIKNSKVAVRSLEAWEKDKYLSELNNI